MTIGEQLKNNFPNSINKGAPFFSAIIANEKQTGAIENSLNEANKYAQEYRNSVDIYKQEGSLLDKTANFFSLMKRNTNETDDNYKKKLRTVFCRNGLTVLGNSYDVKKLFDVYFPKAKMYLIENTGDINTENFIRDFDFEDQNESHVWTLDNCTLNHTARFSRGYGCQLENNSYLSQSVALTKGKYYLHFFIQGKCKFQIINSAGKFWKPDLVFHPEDNNWTIGEWTDNEYSIDAYKEEWDDISCLFITENDNITIKFIGIETCFIDYTRLFKYSDYPTFTILAYFLGEISDKSAVIAPGSDDTTESPVDKYSYQTDATHDYSYLTGVQASSAGIDFHKEILIYAKASGVKAYIEIVNKDEEEDK